jgi:hypothetical protein
MNRPMHQLAKDKQLEHFTSCIYRYDISYSIFETLATVSVTETI